MDWQLGVRQEHDPIDADNEVARMEQKIRRKLLQGDLTERELRRLTNADRAGLWVFRYAIDNLNQAGEIERSRKNKRPSWKLSSDLSS